VKRVCGQSFLILVRRRPKRRPLEPVEGTCRQTFDFFRLFAERLGDAKPAARTLRVETIFAIEGT
jgi:hypothetical protein